jgi:probable F420-dependent oxidoreductase
MPSLSAGAAAWRDELARIEALGFDEVAISEHYTDGWAMEPVSALAFAAATTSRLRFLTLVLNNDLHHPAMLAKAFATLDVLSEGRVSLGIGAGWLPDDYRALGLEFDPPGKRIARLEEGIAVIREFFGTDHVSFEGTYYRSTGLEAIPTPVQETGPPILVGAGGPRMLELAGRLADIVGVHVTMGPQGFGPDAARELSHRALADKIHLIRRAAVSAGRRPPILQFTPVVVVIDGVRSTKVRRGFSDYVEARPDEFKDTPAVLVGSAAEVARSVDRWTKTLGITLWHLGSDTVRVAKVIGQLPTGQDR